MAISITQVANGRFVSQRAAVLGQQGGTVAQWTNTVNGDSTQTAVLDPTLVGNGVKVATQVAIDRNEKGFLNSVDIGVGAGRVVDANGRTLFTGFDNTPNAGQTVVVR